MTAITTTFDRLDPADVFVATNEHETELVPMRKNYDGRTARPYGRGGEIRHGAIQLWPSSTGASGDVEYRDSQPVIKLKITPEE